MLEGIDCSSIDPQYQLFIPAGSAVPVAFRPTVPAEGSGGTSRCSSGGTSRPKVPAERPGVLPAERPGVLPGERESIRLFCKNPFQPAASSLQADLTMKNPSRRMEHAGSIRLFLFFSQKQTNTEAAFAQHIVPARGFVPQERMFYGRGGLG